MTQEEKLNSIFYLMGGDYSEYWALLKAAGYEQIWQGINDGFCASLYLDMQGQKLFETDCVYDARPNNERIVNDLFDFFAYKEYLKKKEEFSKQPRNNKGQFQSWYK